MTCCKVELPVHYREYGIDNNDFTPTLDTYIIDQNPELPSETPRPLVVVCPGGSYAFCSKREGESVALKLVSYGFNACVLTYSCAPMDYPAAYLDLCEAINFVRNNATKWNIDRNKIIIMGFSAAGHLAASHSVFWNTGLAQKYLPYSANDLKPNAICLCYPVITSGDFTHKDTINNVLGKLSKDESMRNSVSLEKHVNKDVPPCFIWHTFEDTAVPMENSLMFVKALRENNISFEYHVFPKGEHGLSLATSETASKKEQIRPEVAIWTDMFARWVQNIF